VELKIRELRFDLKSQFSDRHHFGRLKRSAKPDLPEWLFDLHKFDE